MGVEWEPSVACHTQRAGGGKKGIRLGIRLKRARGNSPFLLRSVAVEGPSGAAELAI